MSYELKIQKEIFFAESKEYVKAETIYAVGMKESPFGGRIRKGTALLESIDSDGGRRIIDVYLPGSIFLTSAFPGAERDTICLTAKTSCSIDIFRLSNNNSANEDIQGTSSSIDLTYSEVMIQAQSRMLSHIHIMSQSTTRKKLLSLFKYMSGGKKHFKLSMSLTDCSDYLSVDRSAMAREIKKLNDDGLIRQKGRDIELFY